MQDCLLSPGLLDRIIWVICSAFLHSMGRPSFGIQTWQVKIHYKCWLNGKIIYKCWKIIYKWWKIIYNWWKIIYKWWKIIYKWWKIIYKWWIFRLVTRGSMVENPAPTGHNIRLRAQELCYIFIPNPSEVKDRFSRVWLKIRQKHTANDLEC